MSMPFYHAFKDKVSFPTSIFKDAVSFPAPIFLSPQISP